MEKNHNSQPERLSNYCQDLDFLKKTYMFSNLGSDILKLFAMLCKRVALVDGEVMTNQGEILDRAFYLISGTLEVIHIDDTGRENVLAVYEPGDFGGGASLLASIPSSFGLRARNKCNLLYLGNIEFGKIESQFPEIRGKMAANLVLEMARRDQEFLFRVKDGEAKELYIPPVSLI